MSDIAAFFDLDRTLIDINSGLAWAKYERRQGNVSALQMGQALVWSALYHLSVIDMERAFDAAISHYRGYPAERLDERTRRWFVDHVAPRYRPEAQMAVADHRNRGHQLVILTNSSCFEAAVAAEMWGFDDWLANDFPTDDQGRLLGRFATPMCYADGKVTHAARWSDEHGVDLDRSYFYSDSFSDVPMLERVGHPRVVAPDPRLRREARRRDWPILDW
jgi:HAD superfamily hydrolase (TIGR01490 family)